MHSPHVCSFLASLIFVHISTPRSHSVLRIVAGLPFGGVKLLRPRKGIGSGKACASDGSSPLFRSCRWLWYYCFTDGKVHMAAWSSGMILASGARGPELTSRSSPILLRSCRRKMQSTCIDQTKQQALHEHAWGPVVERCRRGHERVARLSLHENIYRPAIATSHDTLDAGDSLCAHEHFRLSPSSI